MNGRFLWWALGLLIVSVPGYALGSDVTAYTATRDPALTLALWDGGSSQQTERFEWEGKLSPGQLVVVEGINGSVHIEPAGGFASQAADLMRIEAVKSSRRSRLDSVMVGVEIDEDRVTICTRYTRSADDKRAGCPKSFRMPSFRGNDVEVTYHIYVPEGHAIEATTVNGEIHANRITAPVTARTTNGSIRIKDSSVIDAKVINGSIDAGLQLADDSARLKTVNGSLRLQVLTNDWRGEAELETVNGSIYVTLPRNTGVEVNARTTNGTLRSELPLTIRSSTGQQILEGRIGDGSATLKLRSVNGRLELHSH